MTEETPSSESGSSDTSTKDVRGLHRTARLEGSPTASAFRVKEGMVIGDYRVLRLLGRGGMGEVYEAEDLENGRRVALKILLRSLADTADRDRFLREGRLAAAVSHPHTPGVGVAAPRTGPAGVRRHMAVRGAAGGAVCLCVWGEWRRADAAPELLPGRAAE